MAMSSDCNPAEQEGGLPRISGGRRAAANGIGPDYRPSCRAFGAQSASQDSRLPGDLPLGMTAQRKFCEMLQAERLQSEVTGCVSVAIADQSFVPQATISALIGSVLIALIRLPRVGLSAMSWGETGRIGSILGGTSSDWIRCAG